MGMLIGLPPFIAFFAGMRLASPLAGLAAACGVSLLLCVRMWRRGESLKLLEACSLLLFATLLLYTALLAPVWTVATVRLAVDGGLLAIMLGSLAIGRPFTLQYAREQVPREYWDSPRFLSVNRRITAVWAAAMAAMVAADGAAEYAPWIPLWVDVASTVAAFAGAAAFTVRYPAAVRRRAEAAQAAQAARSAEAAQAVQAQSGS